MGRSAARGSRIERLACSATHPAEEVSVKNGRRRTVVHILFLVGIVGKGLDGALEIVGGVLILVVHPDRLSAIVRLLTQHELSEDPHDPIAGLLRHAAEGLTLHLQFIIAAYLLVHGVVKAGLVVALLRRLHWAYPLAIAAFGLFLIYQLYSLAQTHSLGMLLLCFVDVFVIVLTWLEYRRVRGATE
jgi:uncharacterized membrane protein